MTLVILFYRALIETTVLASKFSIMEWCKEQLHYLIYKRLLSRKREPELNIKSVWSCFFGKDAPVRPNVYSDLLLLNSHSRDSCYIQSKRVLACNKRSASEQYWDWVIVTIRFIATVRHLFETGRLFFSFEKQPNVQNKTWLGRNYSFEGIMHSHGHNSWETQTKTMQCFCNAALRICGQSNQLGGAVLF